MVFSIFHIGVINKRHCRLTSTSSKFIYDVVGFYQNINTKPEFKHCFIKLFCKFWAKYNVDTKKRRLKHKHEKLNQWSFLSYSIFQQILIMVISMEFELWPDTRSYVDYFKWNGILSSKIGRIKKPPSQSWLLPAIIIPWGSQRERRFPLRAYYEA